MVRSIKKYNWKGKKVLIVEDDPAGSFLLSEIMAHTQIEVRVVESGKDAVEICRTDPDIDIILLDMQTPGDKTGYEVAGNIREFRKDLPIIAQSAFVLIEDKEKAIQKSAPWKPFFSRLDTIAPPANRLRKCMSVG